MKIKELIELTKEDLIAKEKSFKKELFDLNYQRKMGAVEKPHRFKLLKHDIARIQTILRYRELEELMKKSSKSKKNNK